jgi:uncharacterized protein YukE
MGDVLAGIEDDVPFNFAGASELERELRSSATTLDAQVPRRNTYARAARDEWRGVYSQQFAGRMRICSNDGRKLSAAMKLAANQVKELAERAQREQDRREEARAWKERQDNESGLNQLKDSIFGEDDKPNIPPPEPPARFVAEASATGRE